MIIRDTIRVLLLNSGKLLLMRIEDFDIGATADKKNQRFWCTVGGKIEKDETFQQAALREIYEETGISKENIDLGPIVWFNEIDLYLKGNLTRFKESYIIAKTKEKNVALNQPTKDEQAVVKELKWFYLEEILNTTEIIFPTFLTQYLPDIIKSKYPEKTIVIKNQ